MNRRSFVKTCVGVAGAGALAASGLSMAVGLAIPRAPAGALIPYWGAHKVAGPAPRGMPYIPIGLGPDGNFIGKPTITGPPTDANPNGDQINVLEWYKYCGHSGATGLDPEADQPNTLVYLRKDDYNIVTPWFKDLLDQPIKPEQFPANGFGAAFRWRSEDQDGANVISGVLVRAEPRRIRSVTSAVAPAKPLTSEAEFEWLKENIWYTHDDGSIFIGVSTYCPHFCCTPGYREAEQLARPRNAWDNIFCTCHNSNYNFSEPVRYTFAPEVATEAGGFDPLLTRGEASGGGGH